jgi:hypothetical protein
VRHRVLAAGLQDVQEAAEVGLAIGVRMGDGVAHPGLGGQVHHAVEALGREQRLHPGAVGHVQALEAKARLRRQPGQPGLLERRVVVVVEVVDADHLVAARQQALGHVHADEAGRAGDQDFHGRPRAGTA